MTTEEITQALVHGCNFDIKDSAHLLMVLHALNEHIEEINYRLDKLESFISPERTTDKITDDLVPGVASQCHGEKIS